MMDSTIISLNLFKEALDESGRIKTLLPEEKCKYCGRELITQRSRNVGYCALCKPRGDKRFVSFLNGGYQRGKNCNLRTDDPNFNKGHGKRFFDAVDRAIVRGDFK